MFCIYGSTSSRDPEPWYRRGLPTSSQEAPCCYHRRAKFKLFIYVLWVTSGSKNGTQSLIDSKKLVLFFFFFFISFCHFPWVGLMPFMSFSSYSSPLHLFVVFILYNSASSPYFHCALSVSFQGTQHTQKNTIVSASIQTDSDIIVFFRALGIVRI